MTVEPSSDQLQSLAQETRDIWNTIAPVWDSYMGEGREFQKVLIGPATARLLALRRDELVLDIGCGNGAFSRRMAELGARVVASDVSEAFIERARERTKAHADRIEYHVIDATDEAALLALGEGLYDAGVSTMALMDMPAIDPLFAALGRLLKPGGRFVFSVMHPCFNNTGMTMMAEQTDRFGTLATTYSVKISTYLHARPEKGLGIRDQPVPHYYFHRPLHALLGACFRAGFVVDSLEEPAFDEPDPAHPLSWNGNYREIPPVLVVRARKEVAGSG